MAGRDQRRVTGLLLALAAVVAGFGAIRFAARALVGALDGMRPDRGDVAPAVLCALVAAGLAVLAWRSFRRGTPV